MKKGNPSQLMSHLHKLRDTPEVEYFVAHF